MVPMPTGRSGSRVKSVESVGVPYGPVIPAARGIDATPVRIVTPMWNTYDLIVAPATAGGSGARSIVRLAGHSLNDLLNRLFLPVCRDDAGGFQQPGQPPRLVHAVLLPSGLAREWGQLNLEILHWPGPAGPTGGPLAEIQLPGSSLLAEAIIHEACQHGARLARGGEFSLRSFLAGRLDLLQAEAVLAVVDARTPAELSGALDRMAGGVGRQLQALRETLFDLVADIEATIDFSDQHSPDALPAEPAGIWTLIEIRITAAIHATEQVAAQLLARDAGPTGRLPRVVLVGRPNTGKSSLFNALIGRDAALVADESGTTRDWLTAQLDDGPAACTLIDLAGIPIVCTTTPPSEAQTLAARIIAGVRSEIAQADVVVVCRDQAAATLDCELAGGLGIPAAAERIGIITRADIEGILDASGAHDSPDCIRTSSHQRIGIESLKKAIFQAVARLPDNGSAATLRMAVGVEAALRSLVAARQHAAAGLEEIGNDEAIVASFLGRAIDALGEVTGAEIGNDIIDRIFSRHCIGK